MKSGTSIIPPQIVEALPELSSSAVKLAIILGKFMSQDGTCYPSTRTLMKKAGIKNWSTFSKARAALAQCGLAWSRTSRRRSFVYSWTGRVPANIEGTGVSATIEGDNTRVPAMADAGVPAIAAERTPHRTPQEDNTVKINFDPASVQLINITDVHIQRWYAAYPDVDIQREILATAQWLDANPMKRKKNYERFLTNWFERAQENAAVRLKRSASTEPEKYSEDWWARQNEVLEQSFDKSAKMGAYAVSRGAIS